MLLKSRILQILLVAVLSILCDTNRVKRARRKNVEYPDKIQWKKEYEQELTDAMLSSRRRENLTRVPQSSSMSDNEAVVEKLMDSITSSEKYLKKVDSIDFRLNRLDIEVHEKSNSIMKQLSDISKAVLSDNCAEKLEPALHTLKSGINDIKFIIEKNPDRRTAHGDGGDLHADSSMESRFSFLENYLKTIQTGVDSIVSTISEVKNRQVSRPYSSVSSTRSDVSNADAVALIAEFRKTMRDHKSAKKCDCKTSRVDRAERYPTDCHEIQAQGFNVSGIYKIKPDDMEPFYVLCDLTTAGGGWTVFQNRFDGSQDFLKGWSDYEYGFGNLAGEFWLGLDKLNYLTNQKLYELRIEMETQRGQEAYAGYSVFTVGPELEGYRISTLGTFYGTAGDSLSYHAGQKFSTPDVDNDEWKDGSCAIEHGGAWWYKECDKSNLNGRYTQPGEDNRGQSMYWISFKGPNSPLSKTKMMIRPLPASKPIDYTEANRKLLEGSKMSLLSDNIGVPSDKLEAPPDKMLKLRGKHVKSYDNYGPYRNEQTNAAGTLFSSYT